MTTRKVYMYVKSTHEEPKIKYKSTIASSLRSDNKKTIPIE